MKIEVYGSGCPKCKKTFENAKLAVKKAGINAEVVSVFDVKEVIKKGLSKTPALFIDGNLKSAGSVPNVEEIVQLLAE